MSDLLTLAPAADDPAFSAFALFQYRGKAEPLAVSHGLGRVPELIAFTTHDQFNRPQPTMFVVPEGSHYYILNKDTPDGCAVRFFAECLPNPMPCLTDITSVSFDHIAFPASSRFNEYRSHYVAQCLSSEPGVSKIGIFEGNGKTITIDCGFTEPPEQLVLKSLEYGDWYTLRRIGDRYVSLNDDMAVNPVVFPTQTGFGLHSDGLADLNFASVRYLYMAFQRKDVL